MRAEIYIFKTKTVEGKLVHDLVPTYLGYAEIREFNAEEVWHLCNWSCWTGKKPLNLHANISTCGHGLCVVNPETQEKWLALSAGWLVGNEKKISDYVFNNRDKVFWQAERVVVLK